MMRSETRPCDLILIILVDPARHGSATRRQCAKLQAASHLRSQFGGEVWFVTAHEEPPFRVSRTGFKHIHEPFGRFDTEKIRTCTTCLVNELESTLESKPDAYVIFSDLAGIALRNIEHLLPVNNAGRYAQPPVDLFWSGEGLETSSDDQTPTAPGLWAVRGEILRDWLAQWRADKGIVEVSHLVTDFWFALRRRAGLTRQRFEKGEVYPPQIGSMDWDRLQNAAFVTLPDWPEKEQWKFLQTLYFGTYFGDDTGLMLNILDP